jgi:hypothetical protein
MKTFIYVCYTASSTSAKGFLRALAAENLFQKSLGLVVLIRFRHTAISIFQKPIHMAHSVANPFGHLLLLQWLLNFFKPIVLELEHITSFPERPSKTVDMFI